MRALGATRRVAGSLRIFEGAFWLRLPWEAWRPRKSLLAPSWATLRQVWLTLDGLEALMHETGGWPGSRAPKRRWRKP